MEIHEIILSLITLVSAAVTAGLIQWYYSRKAQKRQMEAEALKAESEARQSEAIAQQAARQAAIETESKTIANYEKQIEMLSGQLARMNEQIEFKDKRIEDLNEENAAKEKRFIEHSNLHIEQTRRLREVQDRETALSGKVIRLTEENAAKDLLIERHQCIKENCPYKHPATDKTRKARKELGIDPADDELPTEDPQPICEKKPKRKTTKQKK